MKMTKLIAAILFTVSVTSCTTNGGYQPGAWGCPPPHAIPVDDPDASDGLIKGLKNMQQIFRAGSDTAEEFWRLKRKIGR